MKIKIASWNVNGLRAVTSKGFGDWLESESPDIVCLQEIKCLEEQVPDELLENKKYHYYFYPAAKKGYSGVALFCKKNKKILKEHIVHKGLDIDKFDSEGRLIYAEFKDFIIFNGYYPNGQHDHGRVPYKLEFSEEVLQLSEKLKKKTKKNVVLTGDFNTAHHPIDLKNPKSNKKSTGFLPNEREWLTRLVDHGYKDTFRTLFPEKEEVYSWWSYRSNCREKNVGWRIDYFFVNDDFMKSVKSVTHHREVLGSDHAPIILTIDI